MWWLSKDIYIGNNCNIQYCNYISIVMVWNAMPFNSLNSNSSIIGHYFFNYFIEHSPRLKALLWLSSPNLMLIWEQRDIADSKKITYNWKKQVWEILFISKYNVYVFTVSINLKRGHFLRSWQMKTIIHINNVIRNIKVFL